MGKKPPGNEMQGVCFLCGQETEGVPADYDLAIRLARKIRSLLRLRGQHTVACKGCLQECRAKRGAFEKRQKDCRIAAVLFFLLLTGGSAAFGKLELGIAAPAAIGCAIIICIPYLSYSPAFGK